MDQFYSNFQILNCFDVIKTRKYLHHIAAHETLGTNKLLEKKERYECKNTNGVFTNRYDLSNDLSMIHLLPCWCGDFDDTSRYSPY